MAPKREDEPSIILRLTPRGLSPVAAIDEETLASYRIGTEFDLKPIKILPSPSLRAWWGLMSAVLKHEPEFGSKKALSNAFLLKFGHAKRELLIGGGLRFDPMSLADDFTEEERWTLVERAKELIVSDIIPGVDVEKLFPRRDRG